MKNSIKVLHIINDMDMGGAETMLYKLLKNRSNKNFVHTVIVLKGHGIYSEKIHDLGIEIIHLDITKNKISAMRKLSKIVSENDVIDTWLYYSDLIGYYFAKKHGKKIIWNIRHSNLSKKANKKQLLWVIKINSKLSKNVDVITYNSKESFDNHKEIGYRGKKQNVVRNGFDIELYKRNDVDRIKIRKKLSILESETVLVTVGRWDVQKDYPNLLAALKYLRDENVEFKMIMVGNKLDEKNKELVSIINKLDLSNDIILLGQINNVKEILSASDIYISSSRGESFSNAIAEAMLMGVYPIVTDVGESKNIIKDVGIVVERENPTELALGIKKSLKIIKIIKSIKIREQIVKNYNIKSVVNDYEKNIIFVKR